MKKIACGITSLLLCVNVGAQKLTAQELSKLKAKAKVMFIQQAKELNQQCPMVVDEQTTLNSVMFVNWTLTYTYIVNMPGRGVSVEDSKEFMSFMKKQVKESIKDSNAKGTLITNNKDRRWFMRQSGFKYCYSYMGNDGFPIGKFVLTYLDF